MNDYLIDSLQRQLQEDPNSRVFLRLAEEFRKLERYSEALEVLTVGLGNHAGYLPARVSLGRVFLGLGRIHESEIEFKKVLQQVPDNIHALRSLSEIAIGRKDFDSAREFLDKLVLFDQSDEVLALVAQTEQVAELPADPEPEPAPDPAPIVVSSEPPSMTESGMLEVAELSSGDVSYGGDDEQLMVGGAHRDLEPVEEFEADEQLDLSIDEPSIVDMPVQFVPDRLSAEELVVDHKVTETESEWGTEWEDIAAGIEVEGPKGAFDEIEDFDDSADDVFDMDSDDVPVSDEPQVDEFKETSESWTEAGFAPEDSWAPLPAETEPDDDAENSEVSLTLAELYEKQGHVEEAMTILLKLKQDKPNDERIESSIRRLHNLMDLESLSQRKIRFLNAWLTELKEQHHVS